MANKPLTPPGVMLKRDCDHQWIPYAFEVKEHFPNGQIKKVQATQAVCLKCGEVQTI